MTEIEIRRLVSEGIQRLMFQSSHLRSQSDLAAASGVAQATISRIISCKSNMTLEILAALATAFRVPPGMILLDSEGSELLRYFYRLQDDARGVVSGKVREIEQAARSAMPSSFELFIEFTKEEADACAVCVDRDWSGERKEFAAAQDAEKRMDSALDAIVNLSRAG